MTGKSRPFWKQAILAVVLALPALWILRLILLYGVDVPFLDQWDYLCPLLEKSDAGTLRFGDFFVPFGGHPLYFPRLILFGLAKLTHWNIRAELLLSWFLVGLEAVNLWRVASVAGMNLRRWRGNLLLFLACVLLFSPMQLEIWVNGMDMQSPLTMVCLTACLWIAPAVRFPFNCLFTMVLSTISTFSISTGIFCWVLTSPLLWLSARSLTRRQKSIWGLFWLLAFLANLFFWVRSFGTASQVSSLTGFITHPMEVLQFFLVFLGSAFALGTGLDSAIVAQVAGVALIVVLMIAARYVWCHRRDPDLLTRTLPWLMLACFAILNAAMTDVGRWDLGNIQALSSRYLAVSLALPIGLLFLVPTIFVHWRTRVVDPKRATTISVVSISMATAFLLLHGLGVLTQHKRPGFKNDVPCPPGGEAWQVVHHDRLAMRALLLLVNVVDEPETMKQVFLVDDPHVLKDRANFLNRIGYFRPRFVRSSALREIVGITPRDPRQFGEFHRVWKPAAGEVAVAGWAVLPDEKRRADAVVLTYDDPQGEPIMFAVAMVHTPRTDLAIFSSRLAFLLRSGWVKTFDESRLPPGDHVIRAWAFNADNCRAYPIHGSATVVAGPAKTSQLKK